MPLRVIGVVKQPAFFPLLALAIGLLALVAQTAQAAAAEIFTPLGDNTYSYTSEAATTFGRDVEKLAAEAQEEAAKFCAGKGRVLKVVSITTEKPLMTLGIPKATIVFKALEAGDPTLLDDAPVPVTRRGWRNKKVAETPVPPPPPAPRADDLYTQLLKLDDLRKKGILTEEEFQALKAKVIERAK